MGYLYNQYGTVLKNPILEVKNGKVVKYGNLFEDIRVTYDSKDVYLYPRGTFSNPIASFEKEGDTWYIYKYPKSTLSTCIGSVKVTGESSGEVYRGDTGVLKKPLGYYEGTDLAGACAAAYIAFFYTKSSSDDEQEENKKSNISSNSDTSSSSVSAGSSGGGGSGSGAGMIVSFIIFALIIVFYEWIPTVLIAIPLIIFLYKSIFVKGYIEKYKPTVKISVFRFIWTVIKGAFYSFIASFILLFFSAVVNMFGGSSGYNEWYNRYHFGVQIVIFFIAFIVYYTVMCIEPPKKK